MRAIPNVKRMKLCVLLKNDIENESPVAVLIITLVCNAYVELC